MSQYYYPGSNFDVQWRHFHPQLSVSGLCPPGPAIPSQQSAGLQPQVDHQNSSSENIPPTFVEHEVDSPQDFYKYLVRFINPDQKSKFVTRVWHGINTKFRSAQELKQELIASFGEKLPQLSELECGYLEKRGNAKRWIEEDKDIEVMYQTFGKNSEITLWCECPMCEQQATKRGKKRKADDPVGSVHVSAKRTTDGAIEEIVETLREKHGEDYSEPQYRVWARMKLNGQHSSLDQAPHYPLFGATPGGRKKTQDSLSTALTSAATAVVGMLRGSEPPSNSLSLSPGKRARVSSIYLEQLEKLKTLEQSGVLTPNEFEEQKKFALRNIRELNK